MDYTKYETPHDPTIRRDTWLARNGKWAIPAGCLIAILAVVAVIAGLLLFAWTSFRESGPHGEALRRARANPEIVAALGEPIESGMLISGSIQINGDDGTANFSMPLTGPKGKARLHVDAVKENGVWNYRKIEAAIEKGPRIDLTNAPPASPQP